MGNTNIEFNINRGRKDHLTSTGGSPWNEDGALLFTTDTNELFYNVGKITNDGEASANRRQIKTAQADQATNADYATQLGNSSESYNYSDIKTNLGNKMDKKDPTGTGNLIVGSNNNPQYNNGETITRADNSIAIGSNNTLGADNCGAIGEQLIVTGDDSLVVGKYNSPSSSTLFTVGNGSSNNRKNALVVGSSDNLNNSLSYLLAEGNIYIGARNANNKVITQNVLENTTSLKNYPTKDEMKTAIGNVVSSAFFLNNGIPDATVSADKKKQLCIDISRGNGVLCYWNKNKNKWIEISAVYT